MANEKNLIPYLTGTFTPSPLFGGAAVGITGTFTGAYTRIGDMVFGLMNLAFTNKGSSVGQFRIDGLPVAMDISFPPPISLNCQALTLTGSPQGSGYGSTIYIEQITSGVAAALTDSNFANNSSLLIYFSYKTSAP